MLSKVDAVLLDLDDTLVDDVHSVKNAFYKFYYIHSDSLMNSIEETYKIWNKAQKFYFNKYLKGEVSFQEHRRLRIRELFNDKPLNSFQTDDLFEQYLNFYEEAWKLYDDVIPFLERYKNKLMAIVTNGNSEQQRTKISKLGLENYINELIISEEVSLSKPNQQIFRLTCERLKTSITKSSFIGNELEVDYLPSKQLGFTSVLVNRNGQYDIEDLKRQGVVIVKTLVEI